MKTISLRVYKSISNLAAGLNAEISKSHKHIIRTSVLVEAKNYAAKNLPTAGEHTFSPYLTTIRGKYQGLKAHIALSLRGEYQRFAGTATVTTINEKLTIVNDAIKKEAENIRHLVSDKSRVVVMVSRSRYRKPRWLLFLFGLGECLLNMSCFINIGDILLIAAVVGGIIGLGQVYASKVTALAIREIEDSAKRKKYCIIAFLGFAALSVILGLLRFGILHTSAASMPFLFLNPFTFAAFNMLLIMASALLVYYYFPTKEEMSELEELAEIEKRLKTCSASLTMLEKERNTLLAERVLITNLHGQIIHDQQKLFEKVDSLYQEAVGTFKNEIVTKRADGAYPECFKNPDEPLSNPQTEYFKITEQA